MGWYCAWLEVNGQVIGSVRGELDGIALAKVPCQVMVQDENGLQVDVGGLGLTRARLSRGRALCKSVPIEESFVESEHEVIVTEELGMS